MSYLTFKSSFKCKKEDVGEDTIKDMLRKHFEVDNDDDLRLIGADALIIENGVIKIDYSSEFDDDLEEFRAEWNYLVETLADFSEGAIKVWYDYQDYDDSECNEEDVYYLGPKKLTIKARIKDLEDDRDRIETRIADLRREMEREGE